MPDKESVQSQPDKFRSMLETRAKLQKQMIDILIDSAIVATQGVIDQLGIIKKKL